MGFGKKKEEEKKVNQFTGRFSAFTSSTDINTIHLHLYIDLENPHPLSRFFNVA